MSGHLHWQANTGPWQAACMFDNKLINLGEFLPSPGKPSCPGTSCVLGGVIGL